MGRWLVAQHGKEAFQGASETAEGPGPHEQLEMLGKMLQESPGPETACLCSAPGSLRGDWEVCK